jgi:putative colanic acid biosynthesis UDP-glucose lipid carrier transferase
MVNAAATLDLASAWEGVDVEPAAPALSLAKRAFDIVVSLGVLLFVAPLLIAAALAVWIESGGTVVFRQRRTGLGGRPFVIFKLRTMHVLEDGHGLRHATRGDARVTRVGAFLRKSSIDELPQLFNVLKGDMSLVGPRPHAIGHDLHYASAIKEYRNRFRTRPGLTGLAQVSGLRGEIHDPDCMKRRVEADMEYLAHWSLLLDVKVVLKTVPLVFCDPTAY